MTPAHIRMIENHVSPQVATNYCERLIKQPQFAFGCALILDSELERIFNPAGSQE